MKIRMKMTVTGTFHNNPAGVRGGDVVDIEDVEAQRYIDLGYAEPLRSHPAEEHAVASKVREERAVMPKGEQHTDPRHSGDGKSKDTTGMLHEPKAADPVAPRSDPPGEPPPPAPAKRGPGRPRKER